MLLIYGMVFLTVPVCAAAQDSLLNKYGLWVVTTTAQLKKTIQTNPAKALTNLKKGIPGLLLDLRYAGTVNFMRKPLYPPINTTWLRKPAADSLAIIQKELNEMGLGIKIFDAYRPYSVTEKMWEPVKDDRYAADPKKGSGHNRGIAVDLTLIYRATKKELEMGTGFDNFSDTAHHSFIKLQQYILNNRSLLKTIMSKHGFKALETEWWHYSLTNAAEFELMDIGFKELKKLERKNHY